MVGARFCRIQFNRGRNYCQFKAIKVESKSVAKRGGAGTDNKRFSIIIPTYKEHDNIGPLVERVNQALSGYEYQMVFIDDNSNDGTEELVSSLAQKYPVKIVVRRDKKGLASAVVDGLQHVDGDIVGVMDADLQHPPEVLLALLRGVTDGADIAIASRYVKGGSCEGWGLTRRLISKGAITMAHVLLPATRKIKDPMSGYFLFRKRALDGANLKPAGYKILLEMLAEGNFQRVMEVPYTFDTRSRGKSKLKVKTQVDYLKHLLSLMKRTGELTRFLKFILVGLSGIGVNQGLLWALIEKRGLQLLAANAVSIEVSIITNFILNDIFTFRDRRTMTAKATLWRWFKYNTVALPGAGINYGVTYGLTTFAGIPYLISNLIGIVLATLWNYILSTVWAWK